MTRSFGLELLETILARFPFVFEKVSTEDKFDVRVASRSLLMTTTSRGRFGCGTGCIRT